MNQGLILSGTMKFIWGRSVASRKSATLRVRNPLPWRFPSGVPFAFTAVCSKETLLAKELPVMPVGGLIKMRNGFRFFLAIAWKKALALPFHGITHRGKVLECRAVKSLDRMVFSLYN
jgi:hypothetical protein